MGFIKRIFLILFLVFALFSFGEGQADNLYHVDNILSIANQNTVKNDFINRNDDNLAYLIFNNNNTQITKRRNQNTQNGFSDNSIILSADNLKNIYYSDKNQNLFLCNNKSKLNFLLCQIQPNAP